MARSPWGNNGCKPQLGHSTSRNLLFGSPLDSGYFEREMLLLGADDFKPGSLRELGLNLISPLGRTLTIVNVQEIPQPQRTISRDVDSLLHCKRRTHPPVLSYVPSGWETRIVWVVEAGEPRVVHFPRRSCTDRNRSTVIHPCGTLAKDLRLTLQALSVG